MADIVKKNQAWAIEKEVTQGTYVTPSAASKFVQVMQDGSEMSRSKELLERNVFTSSIGKTSPRTGQFQVSGSMAVEARGHSVEGTAPEYGLLLESALGAKRQLLTEITTLSGNTASVLKVTDASLFKVGDILMIKQTGAYHVSPVSAVNETTDEVTLQIPGAAAFSTGVVIAKHTTYVCSDDAHPSLSITRYLESAVRQYAVGCKVNNVSLEGFTTGQLPSFNFGFEGLNFNSDLTAPSFTPSYDGQVPPIILDARVYMDGSVIDVNELTVSIENTLGFKSSVNAENGRVSSRATERGISGSFNPYMRSDSMSNFTKFKNNTPFSIFAFAKIPSTTAGQFSGIVAIYMPNCIITELGEGDSDGIMQDNISFSANRGNTGNIPEVYITLI